ncbi:flagellar basal-body rod protein FlgG [Reinekea marina]|uniref:Flagellar basal-body rod protein FlgG n=1 Tax=Reinekea marina TaxID=1310421 RepID=A0ABV7WUB7_9GAMM|nr:flagellar basal-body rod protein FlgG [Reinekea marina]MBU2862929.1 flagellar basal-body rod protein FlgG [Reinekea forsetii]MDN3649221.1 flagellar basal-body rod protein FlgG [Reinekea marina]
MHKALWVGKTGLEAQDISLATISNNMANASTTGFKKERAVFEDLIYQVQRQPGAQSSQNTQLPSGLQLGTGVRTVGTQKVFMQGDLNMTEQPLDMAINGRGFFQILMPDGTISYTRDGTFHLDSEGNVVTANGYPLEPNIQVPEQTKTITVGTDGIVSAVSEGDNLPVEIGNVEVVDFVNSAGLQAIGNNLYLETAASGAPAVGVPSLDGFGSIVQGALENSNVTIVEEMVDMIATQRAYEMNSKVVSTADQMLGFITSNL